jgi:hypothetical protein
LGEHWSPFVFFLINCLTNNFKPMKKYFMLFAAAVFATFSAKSQAVECTVGNNFGGTFAPCSETPPETVDIAGFEIWRADNYTLEGIKQNGQYTIDVCTDFDGLPDGTVWPVQITVVGPSGTVDFGTDPGSDCALTFTAPEDGTYEVYFHEEGVCNDDNSAQEDNGVPRLTFLGGASCQPAPVCDGGVLDDSNTAAAICPGESTTIAITGTVIPAETTDTDPDVVLPGLALGFTPVPNSGTGGNEFGFTIFGFTPDDFDPNGSGPYSFDNDVNGILSLNLLPPLAGEWVIQPFVYANEGLLDLCALTDGSVTVDFLQLGDPNCDEAITTCEAGTLDVASVATQLCSGETTDFNITGVTVPNALAGAGFRALFEPVEGSGSGGPFAGEPDPGFFINFAAPAPGEENADVTYTLSASLFEILGELDPPIVPLNGEWTITNGVRESGATNDFCDQTDPVTINFGEAGDPGCPAACENPFPQVDVNSLTVDVLPNGSIVFNWQPVAGQIGCRVRATVGDFNNPSQVGTFIKAGPNANQFIAPFNLLNNFTTYNFQVQCGCSQQPLVVGQYVGPVSIFYQAPSSIVANGSDLTAQNIRLRVDNSANVKTKSETLVPIEMWREKPMGQISPREVETEAPNANTFEVFPNPTTGVVNFDYEANANGFVNVRVFDMLGKAVSDETVAVNEGRNFLNFDLSGNEAGIYMIEVREGENATIARVMLK